jgi:leucyl aminopeptidase
MGGAVVLHVLAALARMGVKKNIVALIPAVENMISGGSYHPGDVLRTLSGKTIEILNTDAEGRVILADGITYAKRYNPRLMVDVATLTGAAMVALGQRASALFTNDISLEKKFRDTGEATGDFVWPLPLWEEYEDEVKGSFGDVQNVSKSRLGGAINGAVFLWQFVKGTNHTQSISSKSSVVRQIPWVHLDIAPRMTSIEGDFLAKGAAAPGIGLLTQFLRNF